MITRKFNGVKVTYPGSWDEINYFQFLQLKNGVESDAEIISILTGLPIETILNSKDVVAYEQIKADFAFYVNVPEVFRPYSIHIKGQTKLLPDDIGKHSVAQFEDLKAIIANLYKDGEPHENEVLNAFPMMCAIYVQPLLDGEYSYKAAKELSKEIYMCKGLDIAGLGTFFFKKLIGLFLGIEKAQRSRSPIQKLKRLVFLK